jgi:dimethylargininase
MTIVTRRPSPSLAEGELTFMPRAHIDTARAEAQHAAYRAALTAADGPLIDLPALPAHADATFVEDMLLALPEAFVACRSGAVSRQGELVSVLQALPQDRPLLRIDAPATLDGGDVLCIGRQLYVGVSTRTNSAAVQALTQALQPLGYSVKAVVVRGALHLKTAVTSPRPGLLLLNLAWVDAADFGSPDTVLVDAAEPFAGNSLRVGATVFMQAAHARTAAKLALHGVQVTLLDIGEFAKAEAGLSCLSVVIPPPSAAPGRA